MKTKYLASGPISPEMIAKIIDSESKNTEAGAQSIFIGQVRDDKINDNKVSKINYSAYPEMVENVTEKIKKKIFEKFPDIKNIVILHSTGDVKVGEISLIVNVAGGHRKQTRKACNTIVDLIKETVPIWKKEFFSENDYHWRENKKK